jgi:hypothetical protein
MRGSGAWRGDTGREFASPTTFFFGAGIVEHLISSSRSSLLGTAIALRCCSLQHLSILDFLLARNLR